MLKGYGMYRYLLYCCMFLSMVFLYWSVPILGFEQGFVGWYADQPPISNWRSVPNVDWSTNVPTSTFYNGGENKSLRLVNKEAFLLEITSGDTFIIGLDWYALNMSKPFILPELLYEIRNALIGGSVCCYVIVGDSVNADWYSLISNHE